MKRTFLDDHILLLLFKLVLPVIVIAIIIMMVITSSLVVLRFCKQHEQHMKIKCDPSKPAALNQFSGQHLKDDGVTTALITILLVV